MLPALLVLALVLIVGALALVIRARDGRAIRIDSGPRATELAVGRTGTLVQFSSALCAPCRATARVLGDFVADRTDVAHIEIDITERPDLASRFAVLQTPTTLVVDAAGAVRARIGGAVRRDVLAAELERMLAGDRGPASAA